MQFVKNRFSESVAKIFLEDLQYNRGHYYFFLGKVEPWNITESFNSVVDDIQNSEREARDSMLLVKKLLPSDVTMAIPRINWVSGTVYQKWDHTKVMKNRNFYVLTEDMNVYKCLDNRNGAVSTIVPTGKNINSIRLADGYIWKYMYSIPTSKHKKFLSINHMPVQRASGEIFYKLGSIAAVNILNGGSGYADTTATSILITGSTAGSGATITISVNYLGVITNTSITNGGSGYTHGARVRINTNSGTGAVINLTIVNGVVTNATVVSGGINYIATDTATIQVGGAVAYPVIDRQSGSIREIVIVDGGVGYSAPPTVTISDSRLSGTGLLPGNSSALAQAFVSNGSINFIRIMDPGRNYTIDESTTFIVQGDGVDARIRPMVMDGRIIAAIIENPGRGYNDAKINIVGVGSGARLTVSLSSETIGNDEQKAIENLANDGAIYSIEVTNPGTGYGPATTATIIGDGSGATCQVIRDQWGSITRIDMINYGSGYNYATVSIVDPSLIGTGAAAYAILPPTNGHGYNAERELFATTLLINFTIHDNNLITSIPQDYRIYGILRNPVNTRTQTTFIHPEELIVYRTLMTNTAGLRVDQVLVLNNRHEFVVAHIDGNEVYLSPRFNRGPLPLGFIALKNTPGVEFFITEILNTPMMDKYTGDFITLSRTTPFTFDESQGLVVKTTLEF